MSILSICYSLIKLFSSASTKRKGNINCLKDNTYRMTKHFRHRYMERVNRDHTHEQIAKDFAGALTAQHSPEPTWKWTPFRWYKVYYCTQKKCFKLKGNKYIYIMSNHSNGFSLITMRPIEDDKKTKGHFRIPVTELDDIVRIKLAYNIRR